MYAECRGFAKNGAARLLLAMLAGAVVCSLWLFFGVRVALAIQADSTLQANADRALAGGLQTGIEVAGSDRYATASAVAEEAYPQGARGVIVATGTNFPDALGAASLAGMLDYPVLLTDPFALSDETAKAISALKAKEIVIVGGESAVSAEVERQLKSYGDVSRIPGADRVQTSENVYANGSRIGSWGDTAIVATGWNYPDALSISGFAFSNRAPVFLSGGDGLSDVTQAYLKAAGFSRVVVVGGENAVSSNVEGWLRENAADDVVRLGGQDRYETSELVAGFVLENGGSADGACIATGRNFPDALAGGVLAGKNRAALLLADDADTSAFNVLRDNAEDVDRMYYLGGSAALTQAVRDAAQRAVSTDRSRVSPSIPFGDEDEVKVALIGDSLTDFFDESVLSAELNENRNRYEVRNFALAGTGVTDNAFSRYQSSSQYTDSLAYRPDVVTILFGTNDVRNWEDDTRDAYLEEFKNSYIELIGAYKEANPNCVVFVVTTPPLRDIQHSGSDDILYNLYYALYEIAEETNSSVIDLQDDLMDLYFSDQETFNTLFTEDIIYFSSAGNSFYKDELADAIGRLSNAGGAEDLLVVADRSISSDAIELSVVGQSTARNLYAYDAEIYANGALVGSAPYSEGSYSFTGLSKNTEYTVRIPYDAEGEHGYILSELAFAYRTLDTRNIVFIGDSLTDDRYYPYEDAGGNASTFAYTRWFDDMLATNEDKAFDYRIYNFGQAAASATSYFAPYRDTQRYADSLAVCPDYLFILLGTNDYWSWDSSRSVYVQSMVDLANTYKALNPDVRICIVTSPPTVNVYDNQSTTIRTEVNPLQKEVAEKLGADLYDLSTFMMNYYNSVKTPRWYNVFGDAVHYNIYGYRMFAKFLYYGFVN